MIDWLRRWARFHVQHVRQTVDDETALDEGARPITVNA